MCGHFLPAAHNIVCVGQVVCEKGLGLKGMTLTSLKEEGFKAAFIGIGREPFQSNDNWFLVRKWKHANSIHILSSAMNVNFVCRSASGQQSKNLWGFDRGSRILYIQGFLASSSFSQQKRYCCTLTINYLEGLKMSRFSGCFRIQLQSHKLSVSGLLYLHLSPQTRVHSSIQYPRCVQSKVSPGQ